MSRRHASCKDIGTRGMGKSFLPVNYTPTAENADFFGSHDILGHFKGVDIALGVEGSRDNIYYSEDYATFWDAYCDIAPINTGTTFVINTHIPFDRDQSGAYGIPEWMAIKVVKGGLLEHGVYDLTINGPFPDPGLIQCFSGDGNLFFRTQDDHTPNKVDNVHPEWWGEGNNTLQKAILSIKGYSGHDNVARSSPLGGVIALVDNTYYLSVPLLMYSGISIIGMGSCSIIDTAVGFVGDNMIELRGGNNNRCTHFKLSRFQMRDTATTLATGIKAITAGIGNSEFSELLFKKGGNGIILDTYTQECLLNRITSTGNIGVFVEIAGNCNTLKQIDKECAGSADGEAYIIVGHASPGWAAELTTMEDILIEGDGDIGFKKGIILRRANHSTLSNLWVEQGSGVGPNDFALTIDQSIRVSLKGRTGISTQPFKIKVQNGSTVFVESAWSMSLHGDPELFDIDVGCYVNVDNSHSRDGRNTYKVDNYARKLFIESHINEAMRASDYTDLSGVNRQQYGPQGNILFNPSFEGGRYGWAFNSVPDTTEEYIASTAGPGLMGHFRWSSPGLVRLAQTIAIPANLIGVTLTLSGKVKIINGTDSYVFPYVAGCDITLNNVFNRFYTDEGWGIITHTFCPKVAGNLWVGVGFYDFTASTEVFIDDFNLTLGPIGGLDSSYFASIRLGRGGTNFGGNNIIFGTAAPASGTWQQGDICFNIAPAAGGAPGWVCITAGSPGTWKAMSNLAP